MAVLPRHDDVLPYPTVQEAGLRPVARHIADELKLRGVLLVVLYLVARHLQGTIENDEKRQLVAERGVDACAGDDRVLKSKDARRIVRRTCHHTGKRQRADMRAGRSAVLPPGVPLLPADPLLRHQVRVGTLQTRGHRRLVVINTDMVFRCGLNDLAVVTDNGLRAVELIAVAGTDERRDIAGLHRRHAVLLHEPVSGIQIRLVLVGTAGGLVMADDSNS